MNITRVTTRLIQRQMDGTVWNPRNRWTGKSILLAFVEAEGGEIGVGEAWVSGGTPSAVKATIDEDIAPRLIGRDAFFVRGFAEEMFRSSEMSGRIGTVGAAWSAVDIALWDLIGKRTGLPLYRLLGAASDRVKVYASAGLYGRDKTPDDLAREMAGYVERGFDAVKMKIGGAPMAEDLARVAAVREAIGPEVILMVDALYNLDVAEAIRMARTLERYDIHFFEAPVSPYDIEGQARVAAASPIPVCGNENQSWLPYFRDVMAANAVHFVQFDVAACGGITEGRRIAEYARAHHLPVTLHASSTSVLMAASLQLAAACPNAHSLEYHMLHQWLWDLLPGSTFAIEPGGWLRPPEGPGLGVDLTPDTVAD